MNSKPDSGSKSRSFADRRDQMVHSQIVARGIVDPRLLDALRRVPRHDFVRPGLAAEAYEDWPLPIGYGQTISQPYTVARMVEALQLQSSDRVLEIGTGSGYAAAILACLAAEVHTVERIAMLANDAAERLRRLGFGDVHVHAADGSLGLPEFAPFDAIVVTAGAPELPAPFVEQLADGGRIVIPIGKTPSSQSLMRYRRQGDDLVKENLGRFAFVPLIGVHGWSDELADGRRSAPDN